MIGERLRATFQAAAVDVSSRRVSATVSIGVATWVTPANINMLLERADAALYLAKSKGRNRVELAVNETIPEPCAQSDQQPRRTLRSAIAPWKPVRIGIANRTFTRA